MPLVIERVDPVISPGVVPSNHVHSVVGGNAFAASIDFAQTQRATCATVSPKADKSNYWMANLYFHDPQNGSFIRVPEQPYHKIYYKYGNGPGNYDTDITEFPQEFRMIAGSPFRSDHGFAMGPYGSELGWFCHGGNDAKGNYHPDINAVGFPTGFTACPHGFASAITMPSCWNGEPFNVSNPSGHMAYPVTDGLAGCQAPYNMARFPQIFAEYWSNIDTFGDLYTAQDQPFVLAMGDPTGFGFHLDFINGWEVGALNPAMKICRPGNIDDFLHRSTVPPIVNEIVGWANGEVDNPVGGVLTYGDVLNKLPGCNPVQPGPGLATIQTC